LTVSGVWPAGDAVQVPDARAGRSLEPLGCWPGLGFFGVESIASRLSAVEQRVGAGPEVADLNQQIARVRRDKESAAGAEDYERDAELRDRERQLAAEKASRQAEWAAAHLDLSTLAEGLHRVRDEVGHLRDLLRQRRADREDGAA